MQFLAEELELAEPRVILTLGAEVAGILREVSSPEERNRLLTGQMSDELLIGSRRYNAIHLAHPGIVMRPATEQNKWPVKHRDEHVPAACRALRSLGL